ncbi:MAG: amidohydrolase family protein, partial [Crenarchaeota archaeon]|nr:amidohydrolase family protein [Thermoproteota archaeon]
EKPVLTAQRTLQLATIEGAETLGLDHLIGSLEKGKRADLIVVNLGTSKTKPTYDPVSSLVYTSSCNQVEFVIVDGKILIENGKILTIDEENALKKMERIEELVEENGNSRI